MDRSLSSPADKAFPATQWSIISLAAHGSEEEKIAALDTLCRTYRQPLYVFLRSIGRSHEAAEDSLQEFFLRLMDGRLLTLACPERGRFRTLILTALKNLDHDFHRMENAQKRGGDTEFVSLDNPAFKDHLQSELTYGISPEQAFDRAWATILIDRSRLRLQEHFTSIGKATLFAELFPRMMGEGMEEGNLAAVAQRLQMSETAVKTAFWRLRRHYAEIFRYEVQQTLVCQEEVQDEVRCLMASFG
ncbi:hypothetical protein WJU23_13555 [Prosthecobacter sp. SYSU 5D2]|uniref:RNA polymerase sigma factor n=1 Tax=Prosthecobacter sp. SYSU 5D2 TaxID=3134134 RepID=UPI0031FEFCE5